MNKVHISITPPMIFEAEKQTRALMERDDHKTCRGVKALEYAVFAKALTDLLCTNIDEAMRENGNQNNGRGKDEKEI